MALDFHQVADQIDAMASRLRGQQQEWAGKVEQAASALASADASRLEEKRRTSRVTWLVPELVESLNQSVPCPTLPQDYSVVAVDGSHIDVDRHSPARCYLLNMGRVLLRYGATPSARLSSDPHLYAEDDDLVIRDASSTLRDLPVEGPLLGLKRSVEEVRALADLASQAPDDVPTLGLLDGSLVLWGLGGQGIQEFVRQALLAEGLLPALDRLRDLAQRRTLAVASYISLPRSTELINALRLHECPYEAANCDQYCSTVRAGERPCDTVGGLQDRDLLQVALAPGERSAVFASTSSVVEAWYREHRVHFFYVNAGEEIGRVEVPAWVAQDEALLALTHAAVIEQCRKGLGYPVALAEAHELAVVTSADHQQFELLVEAALDTRRLPVYTSEKQRSKRVKAL